MINENIDFTKEEVAEHRRIVKTNMKLMNAFKSLLMVITIVVVALTIFLVLTINKYSKLEVEKSIYDINFTNIYELYKLDKLSTENEKINNLINSKVENVIYNRLKSEDTNYSKITNAQNFIKVSNKFEVYNVNKNIKSYVCNIQFVKNNKTETVVINSNYNLKNYEEIDIYKVIASGKMSEFKEFLLQEYNMKSPNFNNFSLNEKSITIYDKNDVDNVNIKYDDIEKYIAYGILTDENLTNYFSIFKNVIDPNKPMLALTFDDGPNSATTERILKTLTKYNSKATFFVLGYMIDSYPNTIKKIVEQGSQIGNHTKSHLNLNLQTANTISTEINYVVRRVKEIANYDITVLRPPYGNANETVKSVANCPLILWNVDSLDWQSRNAESVKNEVLNYVSDGAIILMHDIYSSTADAVEMIVPELLNRGYQLVTIDELFKYKGKEKVAGQKVYSIK